MRDRILTVPTNTATTILTLLCCLTFTIATACECEKKQTVEEEIKSSDAVIVATALSNQVLIYTDSSLSQTIFVDNCYVFLVEHIYKGTLTKDTIYILTGFGGDDCGKLFDIGTKYIIYGFDYELSISDYLYKHGVRYITYADKSKILPPIVNAYSTNACMRTTIYNQTEIKKIEKYIK